jgi:hypothetical protein
VGGIGLNYSKKKSRNTVQQPQFLLSDLCKVHNIELSINDILIILQSPVIFDIAEVLICSVLNNLL